MPGATSRRRAISPRFYGHPRGDLHGRHVEAAPSTRRPPSPVNPPRQRESRQALKLLQSAEGATACFWKSILEARVGGLGERVHGLELAQAEERRVLRERAGGLLEVAKGRKVGVGADAARVRVGLGGHAGRRERR